MHDIYDASLYDLINQLSVMLFIEVKLVLLLTLSWIKKLKHWQTKIVFRLK
jgi:hypothetical protein